MLTEISYTHRDWESQRSVTLFVSLMTISPTLSHSLQNIKSKNLTNLSLRALSFKNKKYNIFFLLLVLFFSIACMSRKTNYSVCFIVVAGYLCFLFLWIWILLFISYLFICHSVSPSLTHTGLQSYHLSHAGLQSFAVQFGPACLALVLVCQSNITAGKRNTESLFVELTEKIPEFTERKAFLTHSHSVWTTLLTDYLHSSISALTLGSFSRTTGKKLYNNISCKVQLSIIVWCVDGAGVIHERLLRFFLSVEKKMA